MIVALIDNGSIEPAAHRNLRAVARVLAERTAITVHAVSWKHSDRVPAAALDGTPAWTLAPFMRAMVALGQREFVFVPFFISPQGAIGSALRADLEKLQDELAGIEFSFVAGLAECGAIPAIVAARVRDMIATEKFSRPPVVLVDHGGPSLSSATLRDRLGDRVRTLLGTEVASLATASMEGAHPPLLSDVLRSSACAGRAVIVAPLFLSPGRHAGPAGDIARICADSGARCHFAGLVGTHPLATGALAAALQNALSLRHASTFA